MLGCFKEILKWYPNGWTVSTVMCSGTSDAQKPNQGSKYFFMKITAKHRPFTAKQRRWTVNTFEIQSIKTLFDIFGHKIMGGITHQYVFVVDFNPTWYCFSIFVPHKHHFWYFWSVDDDSQIHRRPMVGGDFHKEILWPLVRFLRIRGPTVHWNWNRP